MSITILAQGIPLSVRSAEQDVRVSVCIVAEKKRKKEFVYRSTHIGPDRYIASFDSPHFVIENPYYLPNPDKSEERRGVQGVAITPANIHPRDPNDGSNHQLAPCAD